MEPTAAPPITEKLHEIKSDYLFDIKKSKRVKNSQKSIQEKFHYEITIVS